MAVQQPQQKRAIRTRNALLAALEELLKSRPFEQISIADIARQAGVAVGSVYRHFEDKTAFLAALLDHHVALVEERLAAAQANYPLTEGKPLGVFPVAVRYIVRAAYQQVSADAHILRALDTYERLMPDAAQEKKRALAEQAVSRIKEFILLYREDIKVEDVDETARMVMYFLNMIYVKLYQQFGDSPLEDIYPSDDTMIVAAEKMLFAYLTGKTD